MPDSANFPTARPPLKRSAKLPKDFYLRSTKTVARDLLGKIIVRRLDDGTFLRARIVETEAYLGLTDRACHTHGGRRSNRTRPMWNEGGRAYVYLIYGMYDCFNVVTREQGVPEAVLIRAAEPIEGDFETVSGRLKRADWMKGPGRLARALRITRELSGFSLQSGELWLENAEPVPRSEIGVSARINVDYAGPCAQKLLRFFVKGSASVSGKKSLNAGGGSKAIPTKLARTLKDSSRALRSHTPPRNR